MGFFCSPFSLLCQVMGYPKGVRALRRDRAFAQELFEWAENQAIFPYLKAQSEQPGVKQSSGADAWAAFPNLTPEMVRMQDWPMEWLQEFAVANGKGRRKLPVYASLNGRFMRDSTLEQIVDKIRQWTDILGRDGRLLFFIANVPADTPPVHIHTAVHAVHTLGRYPIASDLSAIQITPPVFQPFDEWLKGQPEADVIFKAREAGAAPRTFTG